MIPLDHPVTVPFEDGSLQVYQNQSAQEKKRPIIFVHGSPGKAQHWSRYLSDPDLSERFQLIAYDRPGYAKSTRKLHDLDAQIAALVTLIEEQDQPAILVGHSLGGAVVLGTAARHPDKVHRVLALAASSDPRPSPVYRLNQFLHVTRLGWLLPNNLRTSHREVLSLFPSLRELQADLTKINAPVTVVQGLCDRLVPPSNLPFLEEELRETELEIIALEKEGHFLPWKQFSLIKSLLLDEPEHSQ